MLYDQMPNDIDESKPTKPTIMLMCKSNIAAQNLGVALIEALKKYSDRFQNRSTVC